MGFHVNLGECNLNLEPQSPKQSTVFENLKSFELWGSNVYTVRAWKKTQYPVEVFLRYNTYHEYTSSLAPQSRHNVGNYLRPCRAVNQHQKPETLKLSCTGGFFGPRQEDIIQMLKYLPKKTCAHLLKNTINVEA